VSLSRQVFTDKDGSTGMLYLACSDLDRDPAAIEAIYQKRWKVEVFHKTLKSNAALAKSPTQRVRTQGNPFAPRAKLYLKAPGWLSTSFKRLSA
jgi:IS4 transposase